MAGGKARLDLGQRQPRLGDGDRRPDVDALRDPVGEDLRHPVAPGVERDDPVGLEPARNGPISTGGCVLCRSGRCSGVERARRDGERPVERIGAAGRADHVAVRRPRDVPISGPRFCGSSSPQRMGKRCSPGSDARSGGYGRVRFRPDMASVPSSEVARRAARKRRRPPLAEGLPDRGASRFDPAETARRRGRAQASGPGRRRRQFLLGLAERGSRGLPRPCAACRCGPPALAFCSCFQLFCCAVIARTKAMFALRSVGERSLAASASDSRNLPKHASTSARLPRTRAPAPGRATARRIVSSASDRRLESA